MVLLRTQAAWLAAVFLASPVIALPQQNIPSTRTSTEPVAQVTVTDHVTQTDRTLVTETVCANAAQTPIAKIEIDVNINGLIGGAPPAVAASVAGLAGGIAGGNNAIAVGSTAGSIGSNNGVTSGSTGGSTSGNTAGKNANPPVANAGVSGANTQATASLGGLPPAAGAPAPNTGSPITTLQPAVHWDCDVNDINKLRPEQRQSVYYNPDGGVADGSTKHQYAWVSSNFTYPTVILENSAYINNTRCQAGGLLISFTTLEAAKYCQQNWPSQIILATYTTSCSGAADGAQVYYLTSSISFDGLNAIIVAVQVTIQQAVTDIDLSWGRYKPDGSNSTSGAGSGSGPGSGSGSGSGSGGPGNSTQTDIGCGAPPAPTISGLPAAACGRGFDDSLDKLLGFVPFTQEDFANSIKDVAPGIDDTNSDNYYELDTADTNGGINKRGLRKRWNPFKKIAQIVSKGVQSVVSSAAKVVKEAVNTVVDGAKKVVNVIGDAVSSLSNPKLDKTFPVDLGPKKLVDSPFGPAFQIFKKEKENKAGTASGAIGFYCVDCKVKGKIHVGGELSFSLLGGGISKGQIGLDGNIEAGLFLGLAAEAKYQREFKTPIASAGIPGLTIPNIITIGPVLKLDAALDINIAAQGQVLAGTKLTIANFGASLDIVSGKSSANFKPVFKNRFEASGEISAEAGLGLPITVGVGLDIPVIKFSKLVSVIDKPSVRFSAKYAFSTTDVSLPCNNGITYAVNLANDLTYDLFGFKQGDIWKYKSPDLVSGCKLLGARSRQLGPPQPPPPARSTGKRRAGPHQLLSPTMRLSRRSRQIVQMKVKLPDARSLGNPNPSANPVVPDLTLDDSYANGTTNYNESDYLSDADYTDLLKQASTVDENKVNTDGSVYVKLRDAMGQYLLSADSSGTFNLVPATSGDADSTLVSFDNVATQDAAGRLFHYFPETMKAFGISRFRLADTEDWPRTADIVALAPVDHDDSPETPGVYVAADTQGGVFYTIVCNLKGGLPSKVFLVDDPSETKLEALKGKKELQWTVVGGVVEQCYPIAFMSKGPGL
ncbi:hypothetical protein PG989_007095 [Apiospora arundinis]